MGGNEAEFTTELNPGASETIVVRGGVCYDDYGYYCGPAGNRWDHVPGYANVNYGFRATLFLK